MVSSERVTSFASCTLRLTSGDHRPWPLGIVLHCWGDWWGDWHQN